MSAEKILVVDDSLVVVKALELKLVAAGFQVATATDGSSALAAVRKERPDLIVLDINFPPDVAHGGGISWDGFLIMQWLGRIEEAKDIPVVIITGQNTEACQAQAMKAGAKAFLPKPVDPGALIAIIRQTLDNGPESVQA